VSDVDLYRITLFDGRDGARVMESQPLTEAQIELLHTHTGELLAKIRERRAS
jgi:hypothetical protein